jgi:hypothetical protein
MFLEVKVVLKEAKNANNYVKRESHKGSLHYER